MENEIIEEIKGDVIIPFLGSLHPVVMLCLVIIVGFIYLGVKLGPKYLDNASVVLELTNVKATMIEIVSENKDIKSKLEVMSEKYFTLLGKVEALKEYDEKNRKDV